MSFSSTRPAASATTEQAAIQLDRQRLTRLCLIGVSAYDHPDFAPLQSSTANVFTWLVAAMRMGAEAPLNQLLLDEALNADGFIEQFKLTFDRADLDNAERAGLQRLLENMSPEVLAQTFVLRPPTLGETAKSLAFLGAWLDGLPEGRLLVTFSGHGAMDRGRPVLCLRDTSRVTDPASAAKLRRKRDLERIKRVNRALREKQRAVVGFPGAPDLLTAASLFKDLHAQADALGLLTVLMDVLTPALDSPDLDWQPENVLLLLRGLDANLRKMTGPPRGPQEFEDALTVEHLRLALGEASSRVTFIIDACQSGGSLDVLQGNTARHPWIEAGLGCRIISAASAGGLAAEARIGERRQSAATWALTQVLSRWGRVADGATYALGIRNGDLVQRANQLLSALSFRQQLSLHAPPPADGYSAADLPFCGLDPRTRTWSDPNAAVDAIQVSAGSTGLTAWKVLQGTTLRAVLLAVGDITDWTHAPAGLPSCTYQKGRFYVLTRKADADALAGAAFVLKRYTWSGSGSPSNTIKDALNVFGNAPCADMPAVNDDQEVEFNDGTTLSGVFSYQYGANKRVYLQWTASSGSTPPKLDIQTRGGFPFTPADFAPDDQAMEFPSGAQVTFNSGDWHRLITLPNA